jgi:hypothetical protein
VEYETSSLGGSSEKALRLKVAGGELAGVGVVPGHARLLAPVARGADHRGIAQVELEVVAEGEALHQLHRQVGVAVVDAGVEDLHHVGMRQLRQGLELAGQPPARRGDSSAGPVESSLSATGSPVRRSSARYTVPAPPLPRVSRTR